MRRALVDMRPDRFEDIIALVALYRPGPMANIPTYCARKQGAERPDYLHPKLEPILRETFGVIIYQEQVMQIAQVLAGYSLGAGRSAAPRHGQEDQEGDGGAARRLRVGRGRARRRAQRTPTRFSSCWREFADYGFNKSHAAAYALVAYQTAYMKANYPVEFLAASMTLDMGNTDKLAEFRAEAVRLGITVEPPSINRSGVEFDVGRQYHPLCAGRGERAWVAPRSKASSRLARPRHSPISPISPAGSIRARSTSGCWKASRRPARSTISSVIARGRSARSTWCSPRRSARSEAAASGQAELFGGPAAPEKMKVPDVAELAAGGTTAARIRCHRIFSLGPSARRLCRRAQRHAGAALGRFRATGQGRRHGRQDCRDRRVAGGAAHQDRQQDGNHRAVGSVGSIRGGDFRRRPAAVS